MEQARTCFPAVSAAAGPVTPAAPVPWPSADRPGRQLRSGAGSVPRYYTAYANGILLRRIKRCQRLVAAPLFARPGGRPGEPSCDGGALARARRRGLYSAAEAREGDGAEGAVRQPGRRDAGRPVEADAAGSGRPGPGGTGAALRGSLAGPDDGTRRRPSLRRIVAEGDGRHGRRRQRAAGDVVGLAVRPRQRDGRRAVRRRKGTGTRW